MRLTTFLRAINNETLESLRKNIQLSVSEAPQYINAITKEKKKIVYDKIAGLNKWYIKIIGLDEVKVFQDRVTSLQEQLLKTQDKRRDTGRQLADVRQKSLEIQDQIHKVKRQEDFEKYLEMMRQEAEIIKLEKSIMLTFQDYDQMERELFTAFTNAIRDSHEKQRAQIEYTKYFGIILSITGSFLAFVYTTVKKQDLKNFIEKNLATLDISKGVIEVQVNKGTEQELSNIKQSIQELNKALQSTQSLQHLKAAEDKDIISKLRERLSAPINVSSSTFEEKPQTVDSYFTKTSIAIGTLAVFLLVRMFTG